MKVRKVIESDIQRKILSKIRFFGQGAKYSDLKVEKVENDLFNYHLKQLVAKNYLLKEKNLYFLTTKGKSLVTNIDEEDLKTPPTYKVSVYMVLLTDGKVLLYKRLKHPQYGYTGLPSGKIRFGENILATAKRELNEETGLIADFEIVGNLRQIRKNAEGEVIEDGVFYVCLADKFTGTLIKESKEGNFFWNAVSDVVKIDKLFKPSVAIILREVQKRVDTNGSSQDRFIYELEPEPEDY